MGEKKKYTWKIALTAMSFFWSTATLLSSGSVITILSRIVKTLPFTLYLEQHGERALQCKYDTF